MAEDDVRAAAERLVQFHERFAPLFGLTLALFVAVDVALGWRQRHTQNQKAAK